MYASVMKWSVKLRGTCVREYDEVEEREMCGGAAWCDCTD